MKSLPELRDDVANALIALSEALEDQCSGFHRYTENNYCPDCGYSRDGKRQVITVSTQATDTEAHVPDWAKQPYHFVPYHNIPNDHTYFELEETEFGNDY